MSDNKVIPIKPAIDALKFARAFWRALLAKQKTGERR